MTTAENLNRIIQAKNDIKQAIENKGVTVGNIMIDGYAEKINEIPQEVRGKWLIPNGTKFTESTWKEFDGKNMDPSNLTLLNETFQNCIWAETIDLTGWNVIKPTQMSSTFWGCQKLTNIIGIEDLDLSECDMISGVFYDTRLGTLDLSKWDVSKSTTFGSLFHNCSSLTNLDLTGWQTTNTKNIYNLFQNCYHLMEIKGIEDLDFSNVENMYNAFYEVQQIQTLDLSKWGISKAKSYSHLFNACYHLKSLNLSGWNTEAVTNLEKTFCNCSDLSDLNLTGWSTQNVTNMASTFYNCQSLTSFDFLKNWNVGKVTSMENLFRLCKGVTSIDLSNWNTERLTNVQGMFYGCSNLTEVKMGGDVSKINIISGMFGGITTTGTFYYNAAYDYSKIIAQLPSTWTAVPLE